jgi:AraC family transcriptional activator of pyochelin receptor
MLNNEIDKIKAINDLTEPKDGNSEHDYYHSISATFGDYWYSLRHLSEDVSYQAQFPSGIHIGAGIASLEMTGIQKETFVSTGPLASYFIQPPNKVIEVKSTLQQGRAISCGLFIPWGGYQSLPSETMNFIEKIILGNAFNGSEYISVLTIEKLCSPINIIYQGETENLIGESRSYELLAAVMTAFSFPENKNRKIDYQHRKYAFKTKELIDTDLMRTITLHILAKEVGINVRSLTQLFKRQFGCSINQYIVEQRMMKSIELLENGLSVSATAYKVGYSLPYFSEKFQYRFGFPASSVSPKFMLLNS